MKLVIIGSGNVATVLGNRAKKSGHAILQVISRNPVHAKELANQLECNYTDDNRAIDLSADLYIFSISDKGLYDLTEFEGLSEKLVIHTAGSVPMHVLKAVSENTGVLYPLQSIRKEMDPATSIPLLIDANTPENKLLLKDFAASISEIVEFAKDEDRINIHIGAVFVCNFTNHLYQLAEKYCTKTHIDFKLLYPLLLETAQRIKENSPRNMKTGPAVRKDMVTINRHLNVLSSYPDLHSIYQLLTDSIILAEESEKQG